MLLQLANVQEKRIKKGDIEEYFSKQGIDYYRTINSDDALAKALVAELERRNVYLNRTVIYPSEGDPAKTKFIHLRSHCADLGMGHRLRQQMLPELITTEYPIKQRTLPVKGHWTIRRGLCLSAICADLTDNCPALNRRRMRNRPTTAVMQARLTHDLPIRLTRFERAEGQSQFDYLRASCGPRPPTRRRTSTEQRGTYCGNRSFSAPMCTISS